MVALLLDYDRHRNICTGILSGPLKEIKLEVKKGEEAVALWCYAKESRLHYSSLSSFMDSRGKWDSASENVL